jgi:subtilase family serine protease
MPRNVLRNRIRMALRRPALVAVPVTAGLAIGLAVAYPAATGSAAPAPSASAPTSLTVDCAPPGVKRPPCFSPRAYQVAYGVAPLLDRGIDGSGETVVFPEVVAGPQDSDIRADLAAFDTTFGLAPAKLRVDNTIAGSATPYLAGDEELTDTEVVHAIASGATLEVVLVPAGATASPAAFAAAITSVIRAGVAQHAAVVSASASVGERSLTAGAVAGMHAALRQARDQHVTVVAASGDGGALSSHPGGPPVQVSLPASDPLALAVGGTELDASTTTGAYQGEMAWNGGDDASGGGYSSLFARPAYQDGLPRAGATRGVPDVAANAYADTAMALEYDDGEFRAATGTSAAAPLWAGLIALADQQAGRPLGFVDPGLYGIARGPARARAFHDVVTGDNSVLWSTGVFVGYDAGPGWDPVTGWGGPDARYLVPLLARQGGADR